MIDNQNASEAALRFDSCTTKVAHCGEGEAMQLFGERVSALLLCRDTRGQLALHEVESPAGAGPPLHAHRDEDEIFIVQSGRYEFQIGAQCIEAEAGTVIFSPRQVPHTFCNIGDEMARLLILSLPGQCEEFFRRCAEEFASGAPRAATISAIGSDHGITFPISGE